MKNSIFVLMTLTTLNFLANGVAAPIVKKGHIVVFNDKKDGNFKNDLSIKTGTWSDLKNLKMAENQKGIHACFVGNKESIQPLVENMVTNANVANGGEHLILKSFEVSKNASIQVQVISQDQKTYLQLNIGPC